MPDDLDDVTVVRAELADLSAVRETRLRALADAPYAFASTLESELSLSDEEWSSRLDGAAWFLAYRGDRPVGIVAGFAEESGEEERHLIAMWVEPAERGTSIAPALVAAVVAWAEDAGARSLTLWVADGNLRARRLYERLGFLATGRCQPLPSDPSIGEEQLMRVLRPT